MDGWTILLVLLLAPFAPLIRLCRWFVVRFRRAWRKDAADRDGKMDGV